VGGRLSIPTPSDHSSAFYRGVRKRGPVRPPSAWPARVPFLALANHVPGAATYPPQHPAQQIWRRNIVSPERRKPEPTALPALLLAPTHFTPIHSTLLAASHLLSTSERSLLTSPLLDLCHCSHRPSSRLPLHDTPSPIASSTKHNGSSSFRERLADWHCQSAQPATQDCR
jgi:hypothetical protein